MKYKFILLCFTLSISIYWMSGIQVQASDGEEYITISIDATDDNSELMYSLDSEDPDSFTKSNEFRIQAGTSHTIYVKDAAGNITSQQYVPETSTTVVGSTANQNTTDQNIDINLEVGGGSSGTSTTTSSKYNYLTDTPAETGEGTVNDQVVTDNTINSQKIFYDITTEEGEVFHLVVDQGNTANNVYLLKQVKNSDLQALAIDDTGAQKEQENEESLLEALAAEDAEDEQLTQSDAENKKSSVKSDILPIIVLIGVVAVFYYFKIYKKKKDTEMDLVNAADMDDFESEEEEEVDFDIDEQEKEAYINHLLEGDDYDGFDEFEDDEEIPFPQVEEKTDFIDEESGEILPEDEREE